MRATTLPDDSAIDTLPSPATPRRAVSIALWVVQLLVAALFVFSGLSKLAPPPEVVAQFEAIGLGAWLLPFVGAAELAGGLGLLIPAVSALAALGLVGVMIGAVLVNLLVFSPMVLALIPAAFGVVLAVIARARWPRTRALLRALGR